MKSFIKEASYSGNIGVMELVKFHRIASEEESKLMKTYLRDGETQKAWELLKSVTGVNLKPLNTASDQ